MIDGLKSLEALGAHTVPNGEFSVEESAERFSRRRRAPGVPRGRVKSRWTHAPDWVDCLPLATSWLLRDGFIRAGNAFLLDQPRIVTGADSCRLLDWTRSSTGWTRRVRQFQIHTACLSRCSQTATFRSSSKRSCKHSTLSTCRARSTISPPGSARGRSR